MSRLVLLRHGESTANADDSFAGWLDVPLTRRGRAQAAAAGRGLAGLRPAAVHTSVLDRAVRTARLMSAAAGWDAPLRPDWRLNERHYGALQGLDKDGARRRYGTADVEAWRRSTDVAPPPATAEQLARQLADPRYAHDPRARLIAAESLGDVARRMAPYWRDVLQPELAPGRAIVVVSHGNALRVLVHLVTGLPLEEAAQLPMPTATPVMAPALALSDPPPGP
jgi:2,3-bisphosphoglycerate-dependent phosphoglycerate mutase